MLPGPLRSCESRHSYLINLAHNVRIYRSVLPLVKHSLYFRKAAYIVYVASGWLIAINQHSVFTIVTDNFHANSMFVCHFTMNNSRGETFTTTRTDHVRTTWSSRNTVFDCSAGFGYKRFEIIIFNCLKVLIITSHMLSLKAFTPFSCSFFFCHNGG